MLCEKCKKKKATLYYNESINGKRRSFHLCNDCAAAMEASGELEDMCMAFPHFDTSLNLWEDGYGGAVVITAAQGLAGETPDRACPLCGATFAEISSTGKVGCSKCYEVFTPRFLPLVRSLHGHNTHTGRVPRIHRERAERLARIGKLKEQLKEAVSTEAYEQAAVLRDELRRLEANG